MLDVFQVLRVLFHQKLNRFSRLLCLVYLQSNFVYKLIPYILVQNFILVFHQFLIRLFILLSINVCNSPVNLVVWYLYWFHIGRCSQVLNWGECLIELLIISFLCYISCTKCWAIAKPTQLWIIFGFSFSIFNRVATWLLWSRMWTWRDAVYLSICILSLSKLSAIWKHLAASAKLLFCFSTVPYVCQQNILVILLFSKANLAVA